MGSKALRHKTLQQEENVADNKYHKLEDLRVLFLSGVKYPATNKRFIVLKEAKFDGLIARLRSENPELSAQLDEMVEKENYAELRKALVGFEPNLEKEIDSMIEGIVSPWERYEPAIKDLEGDTSTDALLCILYKRKWTPKMRHEYKAQGGSFAGPDESYPIKNCEDVHAAYMAAGRASGNPDAIRNKVVSIAKNKKLTQCLPATAQTQKGEHPMDELEKKKKKTMDDPEDMMDQGADEDTEGTNEQTPQPKKKVKKSIGTMVAELVAHGAGQEVVPVGTLEAIQKAAQLLAAAAGGEATFWSARPDDDVPAGKDFGFLNDNIAFEGESPDDGTEWQEPQHPIASKNMTRQAEIRQGNTATGVTSTTVTLGKPATDENLDEVVTLGTPATKADLEVVLRELKKSQDLLGKYAKAINSLGERVGNIEALKGVSYVDPEEEDFEGEEVAEKGSGLWTGSAFDVSTD